jgi:ATP-dependent DNA helicase Q1
MVFCCFSGHCVPVKKCLTNEAQSVVKILENAQKIAERVTMIKLLDAWQGKGSKKLRVNNLPVPAITLDNCQRFVIHLLLDNILKEDFHFTPFSTISYLVPGPRAPNALGGEISVTMALSADTTTQVNDLKI